MKDTLRKKIYSGLYDVRIEQFLCQGLPFKEVKNVSGMSNYAMEICKWHLYHKYQVWNRKDLVAKIKSCNASK